MSEQIEVSVKAYGHLRRFLPDEAEEISHSVPAGTTLQDLLEDLEVPDEEVWIVSLNGVRAPLSSQVQAGDEVGLFPPIGGGHWRGRG